MNLAAKTVAAVLVACSVAALAREQSIEELKTRLQSAKPEDQIKLCLDIARRQLDAADKAYSAGQVPQAQSLLQETVRYAEQAANAATATRKHLKKTEIEVRKMSRRLQEIKPNLDVDNRPAVQDAIDHLEHARTELLMKMFSGH